MIGVPKNLCDAVIRQIEKMNAEAFREIQITYDEPIQRARRAIAELKTRTEKMGLNASAMHEAKG